MPGIGGVTISPLIKLGARRSVIPNKSDALFSLSGEVTLQGATYEAKETINGWNGSNAFTVVDCDFDLTHKLFPFRTKAKIKPPADGTTAATEIQAKDVNNFWYQSDGTPNEIPIISFFQNIDFADTIFCKHTEQMINSVGYETYPAGVKYITHYNTAQTSDITKMSGFYGTEVAPVSGAIFVSKSGNDTTGDGSFGTPYLTLNAAQTASSNGDVIYMLSGSYDESISSRNNFWVIKEITVIGAGRVIGRGSSTSDYTVRIETANSTVKGIDFDCTGHYGIWFNNSAKMYRCCMSNMTNYPIRGDKDQELYDCVIHIGTLAIINHKHKCYRCYLDGTGISCQSPYNTAGVNGYQYCKYSFTNTTVFYLRSDGTYNYKGNEIYVTSGGACISNIDSHTRIIDFENNKIYHEDVTNSIFVLDDSSGNTLTSKLNKIYGTIETVGGSILKLSNIDDLIFEENIISEIFTDDSDIIIYAGGSGGTFSKNRIETKQQGAHVFYIGSEGTTANDDLTSLDLANNRVICDQSTTTHVLFIGFQKNNSIKNSFVTGGGYGAIMKHSGVESMAGGIYYNILENAYSGVRIKGQLNVPVYNNTIISNRGDGYGIIVTQNDVSDTGSAILKNNIIIDDNNSAGFTHIFIDDVSDVVSDYNIFYSKNNVRFEKAGTIYNFSEWQALGYDQHSIVLTEAQFNSLFTNFDNDDYSLAYGSIAIGSGTDLGTNYDDGLDASTNWGNASTVPSVVTKQQGASWDIGAYIH